MQTSEMTTSALFNQYIDVVNRALGENRDRFPYKQIFQASEKLARDRDIGVAVYKGDPKSPHDWFTIRMDSGTFDVVEHGKGDVDVTWKVNQDHLQNVVEEPQKYVAHPARLDLDWLKERLGI